MSIKTIICAAGLAMTAPMAANAATFVVDGANSFVTLTETGGSGAALTASKAAGLNDMSFNLDNPGDSLNFDFLTFSAPSCAGSGCLGINGFKSYDISATLAFSSPSISVTSDGSGGSLILFGSIAGGTLNWNDVPAQVSFGNTGLASIDFQDGFKLFGGSSITTSATVTLDAIDVAAVPLPAAGALLLLGLGGLAAIRRSKKMAA